jgi:hypothetical protein
MKTLYDKLDELAEQLEAARGRLVLFGLFEPEDASGKWDLVVAAPWLSRHGTEAAADFFRRLQGALTLDDLLQLAGVIILSPLDEFVCNLRGVRFRGATADVRGTIIVHGSMFVRDRYLQWNNAEIEGNSFPRVVIFVNDPGGELLLAKEGRTPSQEERLTLASRILPELQALIRDVDRNAQTRGRTFIGASLRDAIRDAAIGDSEPVLADAADATLRIADGPVDDQVDVKDLRAVEAALDRCLAADKTLAGAASGG